MEGKAWKLAAALAFVAAAAALVVQTALPGGIPGIFAPGPATAQHGASAGAPPAAAPELPPLTVGASIQFGPHNWRVLDVMGGQALLLAEEIIGQRQFHHGTEEATWESSSIRQWLNGEFLDGFGQQERDRIAATMLSNRHGAHDWPGWHASDADPTDTQDMVFLLSIGEATHYMSTPGAVLSGNQAPEFWWLRTPGRNRGAFVVAFTGGADLGGVAALRPSGVRPAMWISQ